MDQVRWGIIGCGNVTEVKSGPAFRKAEHSSLVAVMRRSTEMARDYAERHGVDRWYDDAVRLIHDPEVNAVYIATPPASHKQYTLAAAAAGKPVYVEKPMALSAVECREMIAACRNAKVPLFVAYYRRAQPRFLKIRELLDKGAIGRIKKVDMQLHKPVQEVDRLGRENWRVNPEIAGCGYFCDLGSHMLDLIQFFLGEIEWVEGETWNVGGLYTAEDEVAARFEFAYGLRGNGHWSFHGDHHMDLTVIEGERGRISYSHFTEAPVMLERKGRFEVIDIPQPEHVQQPLIQQIVDHLLTGTAVASTGATALATAEVMDRILGRVDPES